MNLLLGCLAIMFATEGEPVTAAWCIASAAVIDFFDGFAARMLNAKSIIGKDLDSLADMVSFGTAPAFILYGMSQSCFGDGFCINKYIPFIIPVFSALRLAKFNNDTRQSETFIGLTTTANGILISSFPLIITHDTFHVAEYVLSNVYFLKLFPIISAYLLVSEMPLFSLKIKQFKWNGNEMLYMFLMACIAMICIFTYLGIALSIVLYILISFIKFIRSKNEIQS